MRKRSSARVLLLDPACRVLLIRYVAQRGGEEFIFWLTPGGEIEEGESPAEAAVRELREELSLELAVKGPDRVESNCFEHLGEMRENTDYFFHAECAVEAPRLVGLTTEEIRLRQEMQDGFTALRKELSELRAETLKWSFVFWIGQLAAIAGLLSCMLRAR